MSETLSPPSEIETSEEVETSGQAVNPPAFAESTLTNRYQTTIPAPVRKLLGLEKQDKISYHITANGSVQLSRVAVDAENEEDPVIEKFLAFLAKDMEENPQRLQPLTQEWADNLRSLVAGVDVGDISQPLLEEDE